jgi:hypothetical protein
MPNGSGGAGVLVFSGAPALMRELSLIEFELSANSYAQNVAPQQKAPQLS